MRTDCTDEDIRKYYRRQAVLVHPDKVCNSVLMAVVVAAAAAAAAAAAVEVMMMVVNGYCNHWLCSDMTDMLQSAVTLLTIVVVLTLMCRCTYLVMALLAAVPQ